MGMRPMVVDIKQPCQMKQILCWLMLQYLAMFHGGMQITAHGLSNPLLIQCMNLVRRNISSTFSLK